MLMSSKKRYHKWSDEETALLYQTVVSSQKNWRMVERTFPGMSLLQLQNKFVMIEQQYKTASIQNYSCEQLKTLCKPELDPNTYGVQKERKYHNWTQEEASQLFKAVQKTGKNWRQVQQMFPQFTLLQIRNKYVAIEKQMMSLSSELKRETMASEREIHDESDTEVIKMIQILTNINKQTE
ncbi:Myb-like_DNA-binding domain-containing protein [Hexamita inflata]|uniref:Myb-like DNA-binding domain-containing protein n=1 Tax=Hexamita inflata TaxID=28002 RepID=A0AA86PK54_9EUKA|nr:Myb-like DNA-binding domain-containing protein [Hexamita inflata]